MGKITFTHKGHQYSAENIIAVVPRDSDTVEIRYADDRTPLILRGTTSSQVLSAIDRAKADADSA